MNLTGGKAKGRLGKRAVRGGGDVGTIREQQGTGKGETRKVTQRPGSQAGELGFLPWALGTVDSSYSKK